MSQITTCSGRALLLLVGAVSAGGCGANDQAQSEAKAKASQPADSRSVERQIEQGINEQLSADLEVSCPSGTRSTDGTRFACTAGNATTKPLRVTVQRVDDSGNVKWTMKATNTNDIESKIRAGAIADRQSELAILCPDVVALAAKSSFPCLGTAEDGSQYPVAVTMVDGEGNVTWRFGKRLETRPRDT